MKTTPKKNVKKYSYFSKLAGAFAIVAALMGTSANAQGYVTVGKDTAQYTQFSDAYNVGGAEGTYTIHAGILPVGSAISSGSATKVKMTIRSDESGTERMMDLSQNPGNRFLVVGEDASTTVTGTTLTLDSIHFSHGASVGNGGVIYANSDLEIRGTGKFSNNHANQYGGAIYVPNHELRLTGDGSEMTFFGNSDMSGNNDIVAKTVTLAGAGNYYFGGGIDAESITLSDGANAVFTPLSSSVTGFLSLTNSILKIQSEDVPNFSANAISADQNSLVIFEHAQQYETEILVSACTTSGLAPSSAMAALTGENTDNVAFISSTDAANVVTSLKTDGLNTINQFSKKNSSSDNGRVFTASAGSFGDFTSVSQDDLFIFSGDANFGATYSSDVTDLTLSFQSNHADYIRTLTAGTMWAPQQFDLDKTNATLKTYNMRFDGRDTAMNVNGGAMNAKNVNLVGTGTEFSGFNISENNGGVIYASEDVKINGQFVFRENTALGSGGAIYAGNDVSICGTNAFSHNNSGAAGGAISGKTITLSGKNAFTWNNANGSSNGGGAIYANGKVTFNAGDYLFQGNIADNKGGAIHAAAVEFKSNGKPMNARFTENYMTYGHDKNDIYTTGSDGVQFNGAGTYSFDGGIRTQALSLSDGADVTLEAGSITQILPNSGDAKLTLSGGASLNIVLNDSNMYDSVQDTPTFNVGATQFIAAGLNTASDGSVLRFVVDNAVEEKYYLGAIGNFTAMNGSGMIISQINGGEGTANIVTEKLGSAVWLCIEEGNAIAVRKSNGVTTQNEQNIFNNVFEPGAGEAFASQDVIYLAGNINATDEVYVGEDVTSFGVVSNSVDAVRKITATNGNRFFNIVSDATVTFDNLTFSGGKSTDDDGGAILSNGSMLTLRSLNTQTTFQDNSAECGGAIEADELILDGKYLFRNNTASEDGGAIDVWDVTITGENYFEENSATDGGAIWAKNVTFKGNNSKALFSNNTATGKGADIFINSSGGSLTFKDNGHYTFGGGVYDEGTAEFNDSAQVFFQRSNTIEGATTLNNSAQVTFDEISRNTLNDLTINDSAHIKFNLYSVNTMDDLTLNDSATVTFDTEGTNTISGTTTVNDTSKVFFYAGSKNTMADMVINDSSQVHFASESQNTMDDFVINDSSQITFGIKALATINGMTTLNAQQANGSQQANGFAHRATLNFNGGLTIGDGVMQKFNNANVTVADTLVITYGGDPNKFDSQADFGNVKSLSIADGTNFVIYDTNGKALTGKDFAGKVLGTNLLVVGPSGNTQVQKIIVPDNFNYESLFFSVSLEGGVDIILKSVEKSVDPQLLTGNVPSAITLFGKGTILEVKDEQELREKVNAATNETIADAGHAIVNKVNYTNRMLMGRMMQSASIYTESETEFRGQSTSRGSVPSVWLSGYGLDSGTTLYNGYSSYSYRSGGSMLGMEWQNSTMRFGWWFGYGESKTDTSSTHLTGKEYSFGLNGRWENQCGYTALIGGFGFNSFDGSHQTSTGVGEGLNFDSWNATVYAERGVKYKNVLGLDVNPYASIQYISYRGNGFQSMEMTLDDTELDSFQSILGLRFEKTFNMNGGYTGTFDTSIAWHHEFLDEAAFQATVGNNSAMIYGNMAGRDFVEFTAGLGVDINARVNISGNYYLYFNRYSTLNAGMGTVTIRF